MAPARGSLRGPSAAHSGARRPALTSLFAVGLAAALAVILSGGCDDDEECPVCPTSSVRIDEIQTLRDSLTVGDSLHLWAAGSGSDVEFQWTASTGRFLETSESYARWKAPGTPVIARISVIAFNDQASSSASISIAVRTYVPWLEPTYTGASYCGLECHSVDGHGSHYDTWIQTAHASAYDLLEQSSQEGTECAACHTVGYSDINDSTGWAAHNGGFDEVPVLELEGVQCENCHGPLADLSGTISGDDNHGSMATGDFLLAVGSSQEPAGCGECHGPGAYGKSQLSEWETSAHAQSHLASGAVEASCSGCHTVQGFVAYLKSGTAPVDAPADPLPITCAACHDPHDGSHHADLRAGFEQDICSRCHTDKEAGYPEDPHAPQVQMLAGDGGYEYGQLMPSTPHHNVVSSGCATCHYPTSIGTISHAFGADQSSCATCHPEASGSGFDWSDGMSEVAALLAELQDELARATEEDKLTEAYAQARFNAIFVETDGSSGAHNHLYAKQLLESSLEDFEPTDGR